MFKELLAPLFELREDRGTVAKNNYVTQRVQSTEVYEKVYIFPCRVSLSLELEIHDFETRPSFTTTVMENIQAKATFLNQVIFSHEGDFNVNGEVNKRHICI